MWSGSPPHRAEFEAENLAFVYQSETAGGRMSRFYTFVDRESPRDDE